MKLCEYCISNILASSKSWEYHHDSYGSLEKSSEWEVSQNNTSLRGNEMRKKERCLFCSTLHQDVESLPPELKLIVKEPKNSAAWPMHRWNMRTLAKIRESPETIVVTFRYVPPKQAMKVEGIEKATLPTRTFFLFPEDDLQPLPNAEQVGKNTDPGENGGHRIRSWLETCDTTHKDCMKRKKATRRSDRWVPTRLLDISGKPKTPIRLIETELTPVQGPYCSLSHCWGPPNFIQLHEATKETYKTKGVEWKLLPTNFQHAIEIARSLDIGYIWIDSLCIIQDSVPDWTHEASRMHSVYRNSYCNIAIADSPDSSRGAFRTRDPEDVVPVRYQPENNSSMFGKRSWAVVPENLWDKELLQSFLYLRGWVFQERMLSARILHFAKSQVFWDCPSLSACETLPAGLPQPMDSAAGPDRQWRGRLQEPANSHEQLSGAIDQSLGAFWKTAVRKYTSCNLTKGKDKLLAMWGIAKLIRDALDVEYGDGLWEQNLEDYLAWRVSECTLTERPSYSTNESIARDIPTWSWASMDGTIVVPDRLSDQLHYRVTDHNGHPLTFDLKGVKRSVQPQPKRPGILGPLIRGQSDSGPEIQRRNEQKDKEQPGVREQKDFHRSSSPEKIDRDAQPEFHSKSIKIQGHVRQGRLEWDDVKKKGLLHIAGNIDVEIEAFPDVVPKPGDQVAGEPYFVVLAAKQVLKPPQFIADSTADLLKRQNDNGKLAHIDEEEETDEEEFDYAGHGILMKATEKHHFHRTGAFQFRNASMLTWEEFKKTDGSKQLKEESKRESEDKSDEKFYDDQRGRKFWLD